jgi:hypothetical protein
MLNIMPIKLGHSRFNLIGGSYHHKPPEDFGVKMAAEIRKPCDVNIPTIDFSTPDRDILLAGMRSTIIALYKNKKVYVGCMAGRGRTGLFMACMVKLAQSYQIDVMTSATLYSLEPIKYVRKHYYPHAVETADQELFVLGLPVLSLYKLVRYLDNIPFFAHLPVPVINYFTK